MDPANITGVMVDIACGGLVVLAVISWLVMIYFGSSVSTRASERISHDPYK